MLRAGSFFAVRTLFAVATVAALVFAGADTAKADALAPKRGDARFEIKFMRDMIDHHNMAVEMAMLCADRAEHPELEELCTEIIMAQSAEIEDMQAWLVDWYGIEYEPRMSKKGERDLAELALLDGEEFEIEFMQMMIEHHEKAIKEAQKCVKKAYHVELRSLCENIIETQSAEIVLLETWLCDWHEICPED